MQPAPPRGITRTDSPYERGQPGEQVSESAHSCDLIIELAEIRLAFECEAAALAAERQIPDALTQIRTAFQEMQCAATGNVYAVALDIAFHEAVLAATGNRAFQTLSALIRTMLQFSAVKATTHLRQVMIDLSAHKMALLAIEEGRPREARSAMRTMLEADLRRAKAGLRQ